MDNMVVILPPYCDRSIFPEALVIETVDLCDLAGLVVASDEGYAIGVADLPKKYENIVGALSGHE